ncbi:MAG: phosphatase PAP2 family protein [Gemmatimonadetes bacterium]|nr:phosphatase PAP2 family protein [Gemmatimonadota bacterium]
MTDRGRGIDATMAAYTVVAAAALLFPHRPAIWPVVAAGHMALFCLALLIATVRPTLEGPAARRWLRVVADWYPLLIIPLLYSALDVLNTAVWDGRFFDPLILRGEEWLFGGQPSTTFARAVPWVPLSELLHAAYISYYPLIYLPPLALYLRGQRKEFQAMLWPMVTAFLLHYIVFIYFPVQGPRYLFPIPGGAVAQGPIFGLAHSILDTGSSRGAAFPSSHMAIAVVQTVSAVRFLPRAAPVILLATVGLGVGAVYGGIHYATDMVAGAMAGLAIALFFLQLDRRAGRR